MNLAGINTSGGSYAVRCSNINCPFCNPTETFGEFDIYGATAALLLLALLLFTVLQEQSSAISDTEKVPK